MHFKNTARDIKRLLGCKFNQKETQEEIAKLPFKCVELPDGDVGVVLNYSGEEQTFRCEQLTAMMLAKLQNIAAAANAGVAKSDIVISVPGYFNDIQRKALLNSSKIAGFNCLRLMNEHTAVALAYGIYKSARNLFHESEPQHVMFIDMGHASYTVSVVAFVQGQLRVKSAVYDRQLGGRDFDMALAQHVASEFEEKRKVDPLSIPKSRIKLLSAAEKTKKNLSPQGVQVSALNVECLVEEYDYSGKITLETFEELVAPLLDRLEGPVLQALKDAGIEKSQLSCVEIVGGATRVASVKRRLSTILELDDSKPNFGLSTTLNADESVARGCALQCAILSPLFKVKEFQIADIVSFPVRVSWDQTTAMETAAEDDEMDTSATNSIVIFNRTDEFPKTRRITFRRSDAFEIKAEYDQETAAPHLASDMSLDLGKYQISGLPETPEGEEVPKIRVNLRQDLNGIFGIQSCQLMQEIKEEEEEKEAETAAPAAPTEEASTEKKEDKEEQPPAPKKKRFRKVELKVQNPVLGLSAKELTEANEKEVAMAQQDRIIEETANKRNELESYIYDMRSQIGDRLRDFIDEAGRSSFEAKLQDTEDWLYSDEGFDSTKKMYSSKLKELTDMGAPVELRFQEAAERPAAKAELLALVEEYKRLANTTEEAYAHWTDEDHEVLRKQASEAETWIYDELTKQEALEKTQPSVLTASMIRQRTSSVRDSCRSVLNKPKPAPAPVVEEKKTEGEASPEGEAKESSEMDLD